MVGKEVADRMADLSADKTGSKSYFASLSVEAFPSADTPSDGSHPLAPRNFDGTGFGVLGGPCMRPTWEELDASSNLPRHSGVVLVVEPPPPVVP